MDGANEVLVKGVYCDGYVRILF